MKAHLHPGEAGQDVLYDVYEGLLAVVHLPAGLHHALLHTALVHVWPDVWVCLAAELDGRDHQVVDHLLHGQNPWVLMLVSLTTQWLTSL